MPAQVLGRAVVDDVGAQLERTLAVRAGERVVDGHQDVALVRQLGHGGDIDQLEQRVGRAFKPDQFRALLERGLDVVRARSIHKCETQPGPLEHAMEQSERAAVHIVRGDDVVARLEQMQQRVFGGHATGKGQPEAATVERGEAGFERRAGWIGRARVVVALVDADFGLRVRAGLVDRHDDRAGSRVRVLPDVNGAGGKPVRCHRWWCRRRLSWATNSSRSSLVIIPTGLSRSVTTTAGAPPSSTSKASSMSAVRWMVGNGGSMAAPTAESTSVGSR